MYLISKHKKEDLRRTDQKGEGLVYEISVLVVIEPDEDQFHAYAPALPGLHIDGKTKQEAFDRMKEGIVVYIESLHEYGDPLPVGPGLTIRDMDSPNNKKLQFGNPEIVSQYDSQEWATTSWPTRSLSGVS